MKVDEMSDQERRVYDVLEKREHYLSDGFEYYLPTGWAMEIDGVWHDADSQDEMMLIIVRELIKAVEGDEWVDQASGKIMTKKQTFYLNKAIEAGES